MAQMVTPAPVLPPLDLSKYKLPGGPSVPASGPTSPPTANSPMVMGMFPRAPLNPNQFKLQSPASPASPGVPAQPAAFAGGTLANAPQGFFSKIFNGSGPTPLAQTTQPKQGFFSKLLGGTEDLVNTAADNTTRQQAEGAEKMKDSIVAGANEIGKSQDEYTQSMKEGNLDSGTDAAKGVFDSTIGTAAGGVQAVFAPITGIIQAIADKASDSNAVQNFALGGGKSTKDSGTIYGLMDQLDSKMSELAQQHPEAARRIGDAANVLLAMLGGDEAEGATGDLGGLTKDVTSNLKNQVTDASKSITAGVKNEIPYIAASAKRTADIFKNTAQKTAVRTGKAVDAVKDQSSGALKSAYSQIYGLPPSDIEFLMKNPHFATPEALGNASLYNLGKEVETKINEARTGVPKPEDLSEEVRQGLQAKVQSLNEHAKLYNSGPPTGKPGWGKKLVSVDPQWLRNTIEDKSIAGVTINDKGRVEYGDANSKIRPSSSPEGGRKIQDLWDTWGPVFAKGKMSVRQFLNFRQDLADMADYKGGVDTALKRSAHDIRDSFNKNYRSNINGLTDLDKEHARLEKDLDESLTGLGQKDSTNMGNIKMNEGSASNILNADKNTKTGFAKRLEKISPGITRKIAAANKFSGDWGNIVDDTGSLREGALSNIKNSLNAGRDIRLEKLEGIIPGITNHLRLVKAAEDYSSTLGLKPGKYASGAAVSQILTGNPFVGIAAMALTSPSVGLRVLRSVAKMSGTK